MTLKQKKLLLRICIAAVITVTLFFLNVEAFWFLWLVPYLILGIDVIYKAFCSVMSAQMFDENFLMSLATLGAIVLGEYTEGVAVMLFYQTGELFQSLAIHKSRKNISSLMDVCPEKVNLITDDGCVEVSPDSVEVGSLILLKAGERCAIDGVVVEGESTLDTSFITGESLPRDIFAGDEIVSGCINLSGVLKIRTSKEFGKSAVNRILEIMEGALAKKSRFERFVTRFSKVYTPVVCALAFVIAWVVPIINFVSGNPLQFDVWIYRALNFLVISCPCALVVSIPLGFFAGLGAASRSGILIKNSQTVEKLDRVKIVVFDKTGTLTCGKLKVEKVVCQKGREEELLFYASHTEIYSSHPISQSIKDFYQAEIDASIVKDLVERSGKGVSAVVNGHKAFVGNEKLMQECGVVPDFSDEYGCIVHVCVDGEYFGYILIRDSVKDNAQQSISMLKKAGVLKTCMLTGDRKEAAEPIARKTGIDGFYASLLPEEKVEWIEKIKSKTKKGTFCAYVGDGINDAPVLATSDVGIAMGALGTDAAIESAYVVVTDDNLEKISAGIKICQKTMSAIRANIVFSIAVKVLFLIFSALGYVNMWFAVFADVGVMIIAVLNSLRCLYLKG